MELVKGLTYTHDGELQGHKNSSSSQKLAIITQKQAKVRTGTH